MKSFVVFALMLLAPISSSQSLAWWLTLRLEARESEFLGRPVSEMQSELVRVSPLSCELGAEQFSAAQCQEVASNNMQFRLTGDFNGDGIPEIAQTAVGRLKSGQSVTALFLFTQGASRRPQVFLRDGIGFSVVYPEDSGLAWSSCMECGHAVSIRWNKKQRRFIELPPESYGAEPSNNSFKPRPLRGLV